MDKIMLQHLIVQILEKIFRMERLLDIAFIQIHKSDRVVIETFKKHLEAIKTNVYFAMKYIGPRDQELKPNIYRAIFKIVNSCFLSFDELHLHLSYIQGQWTKPETIIFVRALFEPFSVFMKPNKNFSIVLSDTYMFEEVDLSIYLANVAQLSPEIESQTPTLFLPKIEAENPLQWGTLVHEMGHAISSPVRTIFNKDEINKITRGNPKGEEMLLNWTEEIYCDLISLHLLGPAYLASFVDFIVIMGSEGFLENFSFTHPHPRFRIVFMNSILKNKEIEAKYQSPLNGKFTETAGFFYWLFEERVNAEKEFIKPPLQDPTNLFIDIGEFRDRLEERVDKIVPFEKAIPTFDQRKFASLYDRLQNGIPIGSYSPMKIEKGDEEAEENLKLIEKKLESLESGQENGIKEHLHKVRERVRETPCTIAEIINAGWLFKCEKIYDDAIKNLNHFGPDEEIEFRTQIYRLDGLLRYSIETSFLNQLFFPQLIERDTTNGEA